MPTSGPDPDPDPDPWRCPEGDWSERLKLGVRTVSRRSFDAPPRPDKVDGDRGEGLIDSGSEFSNDSKASMAWYGG